MLLTRRVWSNRMMLCSLRVRCVWIVTLFWLLWILRGSWIESLWLFEYLRVGSIWNLIGSDGLVGIESLLSIGTKPFGENFGSVLELSQFVMILIGEIIFRASSHIRRVAPNQLLIILLVIPILFLKITGWLRSLVNLCWNAGVGLYDIPWRSLTYRYLPLPKVNFLGKVLMSLGQLLIVVFLAILHKIALWHHTTSVPWILALSFSPTNPRIVQSLILVPTLSGFAVWILCEILLTL